MTCGCAPEVPGRRHFIRVTGICRSVRLSLVLQGTGRGRRAKHFLNGVNSGMTSLALGIVGMGVRSSPCGAQVGNAAMRFCVQRVMALASASKGLMIVQFATGDPDKRSYQVPTARRTCRASRVVRVDSTHITHVCGVHNSGCAHLDRMGLRRIDTCTDHLWRD